MPDNLAEAGTPDKGPAGVDERNEDLQTILIPLA
jgi:hypothetical protein